MIFSLLLAMTMTLQDRLHTASPGDYIVIESGKTMTVVAIRDQTAATLVLEEISAPAHEKPSSFPNWIRAKAPGHTSWSLTEIDLIQGVAKKSYSFSKGAWLTCQDNLLTALLNRPLTPIQETKKIGPPPQEGESDLRKTWKPAYTFEGEEIEERHFEICQTTLDGNTATLYFDKDHRTSLPIWIEIATPHISAPVRTIDAGHDLPSLYRFPRK